MVARHVVAQQLRNFIRPVKFGFGVAVSEAPLLVQRLHEVQRPDEVVVRFTHPDADRMVQMRLLIQRIFDRRGVSNAIPPNPRPKAMRRLRSHGRDTRHPSFDSRRQNLANSQCHPNRLGLRDANHGASHASGASLERCNRTMMHGCLTQPQRVHHVEHQSKNI